MTEPFISVRPMATVQEVARVLRSNHIRVAPVLTAEGRLVGVISETDLTRAALRAGPDRLGPARRVHLPDDRHDHRWLARDLMSAWIVDVSPTASLAEAARIMRAKRVSWLPVVDDRRHLVGVLSQSDVLNRAPIRARHMGTAQQSTGPESNSP
jgi:CBS domain-containing protein